jgi:branched-chain amino acid aminotransferase
MSATAWIDGKLLSFVDANLDSTGWPARSGIFETVKTVDGLPWALSRHMRRALNSARRNDQPFPSEELIRTAVSKTISANPYPIGRLRILFGADGSLAVTHQEYVEIESSAKLKTRSYESNDQGVVQKRYPYNKNLDLLAQAKVAGFDDYLLINQNHQVTETTVSNLVFLINDQWVTPPIGNSVLPGVMRALLVEKSGVLVRQVRAEQIDLIQSGFLVSSLKIAQPIGQIDHRRLEISAESEQMRARFAATALATSVG